MEELNRQLINAAADGDKRIVKQLLQVKQRLESTKSEQDLNHESESNIDRHIINVNINENDDINEPFGNIDENDDINEPFGDMDDPYYNDGNDKWSVSVSEGPFSTLPSDTMVDSDRNLYTISQPIETYIDVPEFIVRSDGGLYTFHNRRVNVSRVSPSYHNEPTIILNTTQLLNIMCITEYTLYKELKQKSKNKSI